MIKQYKALDRIKEAVEKTHPLVTKDIMEKFEKFGTSPIFSHNGKIQTLKFIDPELKIIDESELEDFRNDLKRFNYSANNFWFVEYDKTNYTSTLYTPNEIIIITAKKSGKSKEYKTGNGSSWVAEFAHDLQKKFYN